MSGLLVATVAAISLAAPAHHGHPATARRPAHHGHPATARRPAHHGHPATARRPSHHGHHNAMRPPGRVRGARVLADTNTGVRIMWSSARRGSAPIEGYRLRCDGVVAGQTPGHVYVVKFNLYRAHRITVTAVDTRGRLGRPSRALRIAVRIVRGGKRAAAVAGDSGPGVPGQLTVSEVSEAGATLWWTPATPGSARIIGYRVYRDGALVGQTTQDSMRLTRLSSLRTYHLAVAAVDADHRVSARTPELALTTSHTPPEGPALISAEHVTDTSATLSWQAGIANSGRLVGYLLFEDGVPERVVAAQVATVTLASERHTHSLCVPWTPTAISARPRPKWGCSPPTRRPPRRAICTPPK